VWPAIIGVLTNCLLLCSSSDATKGELDVKGMESVRRDIIPLVRELIEELLSLILVSKDMSAAIARTKECIRRLLSDGYTLFDLMITKALWRGTDAGAYGMKLAHIELAEKLRKRYPDREIVLGQRLSYVLVQGEKGVKQYQQSEEPLWVDDHGLGVDTDLYVSNYLQKPIVRLFALAGLLGSVEKATKVLFTGDHMRSVKRAALAPSEKGLGAFFSVKVSARCAHCKRPIGAQEAAKAGPSAKAAANTGTQKTLAFSRMGAKSATGAAPAAAAATSARPTPSAAAPSAPSHGLCSDCERHLDRVMLSRVAEYAERETHMDELATQWSANNGAT
jgi:hypothetical protein